MSLQLFVNEKNVNREQQRGLLLYVLKTPNLLLKKHNNLEPIVKRLDCLVLKLLNLFMT